MLRTCFLLCAAGLVVLLLGNMVPGKSSPVYAQVPGWQVGDIVVAVGSGSYQVYDHLGRLKTILDDELGGYTTDCSFNPELDKLYTTNFTHTKVVVYAEETSDDQRLLTIHTDEVSPQGHSGALVFGGDGSFYVGHADGNRLVHHYDASGFLLQTFPVSVETRVRGLDLAVDQSTLYYTSQGRGIHRYDVARRRQLPDFATLADEGYAFGLRLLPPGDGSGGMLVADGEQIKRLDGSGEVVQTYDAPEKDNWFALNRDADGRTFWAADSQTDQLYRFDLISGTVVQEFAAGSGNTVFGVCIRGELTAGVSQAESVLPVSYGLSQNAPNPFNPSTLIEYRMPVAGEVSLLIYNLLGQEIRTLVHGDQTAGTHQAIWDSRDRNGRPVSSGVYLYRFVSEGWVESRRMLLLK